jgi:hypothetical protein
MTSLLLLLLYTLRRTPFRLVDVIVSIRINCNKVVPVLDDVKLFGNLRLKAIRLLGRLTLRVQKLMAVRL